MLAVPCNILILDPVSLQVHVLLQVEQELIPDIEESRYGRIHTIIHTLNTVNHLKNTDQTLRVKVWVHSLYFLKVA